MLGSAVTENARSILITQAHANSEAAQNAAQVRVIPAAHQAVEPSFLVAEVAAGSHADMLHSSGYISNMATAVADPIPETTGGTLGTPFAGVYPLVAALQYRS